MLIYGLVAGLLASILLGPIGVLCIQRTISKSQRDGFVSGMGAAVADTLYAALAVFALAWIENVIISYEMWFEILGGMLIMGFGLMMFFKKPQRISTIRPQKSSGGDLANFLSVLFLSLPNPGYFFIFVTIFTAIGILGVDFNTLQKWLIVLGVFAGATSWWFFLTWIVNKLRSKFTIRSVWKLNKISGAVIAILGAYAVLSVVYQLVRMLVKSGVV